MCREWKWSYTLLGGTINKLSYQDENGNRVQVDSSSDDFSTLYSMLIYYGCNDNNGDVVFFDIFSIKH